MANVTSRLTEVRFAYDENCLITAVRDSSIRQTDKQDAANTVGCDDHSLVGERF